FPPDAMVLYDLSLRPHAEELMPQHRSMPLEPGLTKMCDEPETPAMIFADGGSSSPLAKKFAWPESDAYGKLTRNHYRVVSVMIAPPNRRFAPVSGVYAVERTVDGAS